MKHIKTNSDIGSVLIGNTEWTFAIPNIGGDGTTHVFIAEQSDIKPYREENYNKFDSCIVFNEKTMPISFISSAQGEFGIYENDCDFNDKKQLLKPIMKLSGRYGIYHGIYCVVLVEWGR